MENPKVFLRTKKRSEFHSLFSYAVFIYKITKPRKVHYALLMAYYISPYISDFRDISTFLIVEAIFDLQIVPPSADKPIC